MPTVEPAASDSPFIAQGLASLTAAGLAAVLLKLRPALQLEFFAAGAARLTSLFTGQPVLRVENGWMLPDATLSIVVTGACSATDFFLMVAMLISWRMAGRKWPVVYAVLGGILCAVPFSIVLNALRIVVVAQLHRWIAPHLSESYGPFLHMATGVAIFLPSLIALNGLLHFRFSSRRAVSA